MHVLLIDNPESMIGSVRSGRWGEIKRLGRLHFAPNAYGQGELYLELPADGRRQHLREVERMLSGIGLQVRGAYRNLPEYDVALPVSRLHPIKQVELAAAYEPDLPCPWCDQGDMRVAHVVNVRRQPQRYETVVFCADCRRIVHVDGRIPLEDWGHLGKYLAQAPRVEPQFKADTTFFDQELAAARRIRAAKRRRMGLPSKKPFGYDWPDEETEAKEGAA